MQLRLDELDNSSNTGSNKENDTHLGISEDCLQKAMASLKRKRKSQTNVRKNINTLIDLMVTVK